MSSKAPCGEGDAWRLRRQRYDKGSRLASWREILLAAECWELSALRGLVGRYTRMRVVAASGTNEASPLWLRATCRTMARPRPVPLEAGLPLRKRVKSSSSLTAAPSSATSITKPCDGVTTGFTLTLIAPRP